MLKLSPEKVFYTAQILLEWTEVLSHREFKQSEAPVSARSTICFKIMH